MAAKRRKQRRQDNKSVPPPSVAASSPNRPKEAPATKIPDDTTNMNGPSNIPQITGLERCKLILDAVTETSIERVVDLTILLGKFFRGIRRGISLIDMVSYVVLIVATQSWLSLSLLQNVVYLFILSGIEFQFPFQILKKLLIKYKTNLASDFRLLVLSCVCIAFVNDALMSNSHLPAAKRLKIYWNVFFAQMIMYGCIPFMNSFADIVNVGLAIISFTRIAVEVAINCTTSDLFASINFLPEALVFHSVFLSILGTCLTYYEADKFLDKYMRVPSPQPPPQLAA